MVAVVIFSTILYIFYLLLSPRSKNTIPRQAKKIVEKKTYEDKSIEGLIVPSTVVTWTGSRPSGWRDYDILSIDQRGFFDYFIDAFCESEYWDLKGNDNYAFLLMHGIKLRMNAKEDRRGYQVLLAELSHYYPITRNEVIKLLLPTVQSIDELNVIINRKKLQSQSQISELKEIEIPENNHQVLKKVEIQEEIILDEPVISTTITLKASQDAEEAEIQGEAIRQLSDNSLEIDMEVDEQTEEKLSEIELTTALSISSNEGATLIPTGGKQSAEIGWENLEVSEESSIVDVGETIGEAQDYKYEFQQWLKGDTEDEDEQVWSSVVEPSRPLSAQQSPTGSYISDYQLGNFYRDELGLTNAQVALLNQITYYPNNFNEIKECRRELARLFVNLIDEMDAFYRNAGSTMQDELNSLAGFAANKIYRYRQGSANYRDATKEFLTEFHYLVFKVAENALRECYSHKRKLTAELQYNEPLLKQQVEDRLLTVAREAVEKLKSSVASPKVETEVLLNEQNTGRWKIEFERIEKELLGDSQLFYSAVCELGKRNMLNPSIELIYFEACKSLAKKDRKLSVQLYLHYYYHDLNSTSFDNRQLNKSFQKAVFADSDVLAEFENILGELTRTKDLEKALNASGSLFIKRRRILKINHNE